MMVFDLSAVFSDMWDVNEDWHKLPEGLLRKAVNLDEYALSYIWKGSIMKGSSFF